MKTEYKYIQFDLVEQDETKKTQAYTVRNISLQIILGYIKRYGAWRQYCFFPMIGTIYGEGCLKDVADFVKQLMEDRKKGGT